MSNTLYEAVFSIIFQTELTIYERFKKIQDIYPKFCHSDKIEDAEVKAFFKEVFKEFPHVHTIEWWIGQCYDDAIYYDRPNFILINKQYCVEFEYEEAGVFWFNGDRLSEYLGRNYRLVEEPRLKGKFGFPKDGGEWGKYNLSEFINKHFEKTETEGQRKWFEEDSFLQIMDISEDYLARTNSLDRSGGYGFGTYEIEKGKWALIEPTIIKEHPVVFLKEKKLLRFLDGLIFFMLFNPFGDYVHHSRITITKEGIRIIPLGKKN